MHHFQKKLIRENSKNSKKIIVLILRILVLQADSRWAWIDGVQQLKFVLKILIGFLMHSLCSLSLSRNWNIPKVLSIFRREALVLNSAYAWMSQVNTDLIWRYTTQRHCLRASIKYQWPKSNWSRIYSWWSNSQNKKNFIWCMSKYVGTLTDNYKQGGAF